MTFEVNFDGLVGPTHNYAGLSYGNLASITYKSQVSNPREAALQGLAKMKSLADLGLKQAVLPPQERPDVGALRRLGFGGTDKEVLARAAKEAPDLLMAVYSASSMWTANAATVSPSLDTEDGRVHFTPANLVSKFHRSLETTTTTAILRKIFSNSKFFKVHDPLPQVSQMGDEGAANHTRLAHAYGQRGLEFFVYGAHGLKKSSDDPQKFPARQTLEASQAIARLHGLSSDATVFGRQSPEAIDAGVFHNDVAGVGNLGVYFYHEKSFSNSNAVMRELSEKYLKLNGEALELICVPASQVSLEDIVKSYLFNSQLVSLPKKSGQKSGNPKTALIMPEECLSTPSVARYVEQLLSERKTSISEVHYFDLKQSMRNGGGPACLRLRVVLSEKEIKALGSRVILDEKLYGDLVGWVKKHYRDQLSVDDFKDPSLMMESRSALDHLTQIMKLGSIYPFQKS